MTTTRDAQRIAHETIVRHRNVSPPGTPPVCLCSRWRAMAGGPFHSEHVAAKIVEDLTAEGVHLCTTRIEDHPVYPKRIYEPLLAP